MKDLYFEFYNDVLKNFEQIRKQFNFLFLKKADYPAPNQNLHRYFNRKQFKTQTISYFDPHMISHAAFPVIKEFESTRKIFDYIIKNDLSPFEKLAYEKDVSRQPSITKNLIADFIGRLSELSQTGLDFNKQLFEKAYSELEDFLFSDRFKYKVLVNLYGPLGELDSINLGEGKIKKADYETARLFCYYYSDPELFNFEMFENDYYLEVEREILKENWRKQLFKEDKIIEELFNCIVLSNTGNIELGKSLRLSSAWPLIKTQKRSIKPIEDKYGANNLFRYEFNNQTKEKLAENLKKLENVDYDELHDKIKTAFRRLKNSKSTLNIENKIIELVLSIEYLINTSPHEVTLQLCLKIINMYTNSNQDKKLYKLLKDFFNLRGNVVHGNSKVVESSKTVNLIQSVEKIILEVIIEFIILNQTYSLKDINNALHNSLHIDKTVIEILNNNSA
jgi:hypothetical protein